MLPYFNSTRFKMRVARTIFAIIRFLNLKQKRVIRRRGVRFDVDLAEGIDLSIFLFGSFQKHVTSNRLIQIPEDAVIFDVGANVGSISLIFAATHAQAVVYSFEPTHSAFGKLKRNIEINEDIVGKRVIPVQTFVSASNTESSHLTAYSSWPIDDLGGNRHPVHLGVSKDATGKQITLDTFAQNREISRLDLIKIDTDGYELDVLRGAMSCIGRFKPTVIFELTTYLMRERQQSFSDYEELLHPMGYRLLDTKSSCEVRGDNLEKLIPSGGGIDIVAIPPGRNEQSAPNKSMDSDKK